jgi:hypothetical protein
VPALFALVAVPALGAEKMIDGLVFHPVQQSRNKSVSVSNCVGPFSLWQEPEQYFRNVQKKRVNRAIRFTRKGEVLKNFPDELTLHFVFSLNYPYAFCTAALPQFNPGKIKFKAAWRNPSQTQTLLAEGAFVLSGRQHPDIWCEDGCGGTWVYELRIKSSGVPLTDKLEITVESENGSRVAQFTGELGKHEPQSGLNPVLNSNLVPPTTELAKP